MKRKVHLAIPWLMALFLLISFKGYGQLMVEEFSYPIGSLLTDNGWTAHSGAGTQAIDVTSGLSFAGYLSSGIGGAALLDNNGEDVHKNFPEQTTGIIYASFLIQTEATNSAGYFLHLGQTTIGTTYFTRVWVNATGDGLGIGSSTPAEYSPITAGVPTLVVVKLNLDTKLSELFAFNTFPTAEPATPLASFTETVTFSNVGSIALRQYNAAQRIIVDGIRVATNWADAVTADTAPPTVALPTITPAGGNFYAPVEVAISTLTEGASIYYTTDGTDPDATATLYTAPFTVSTTTTVKAIGMKAGLDNSSIASAILNFPPLTDVATIAALREGLTDGTVYKLTGQAVLTYQTTVRNAKYVQDATAAILIDDPTGKITTSYDLYDGITGITGTLGAFQSMLQFTPVADPGPASSVNNAVNPLVKTLDAITDADQGKLIRVNQASFTGTGNFASGQNYPITDPSGSGVVRTQYNTLDYIGEPIPQTPQQITGVLLQYQSTHQLIPRSLADMVTEPYSPYFQFSTATANLPAWFGANRGMASFGNNLLIAKQSPVTIHVLNRLTGLETGTLNTTGIAGGFWALNDIEVSDDGVIFAANGVITNANGNFKVYQVSSDPAVDPVLVIDYDVSGFPVVRLGDKITVVGSVADGTAALYAADGSENRIFKWTIDDTKSFGTPEVITLPGRGGSNVVAPLPNGNFYYTGTGINVQKFSADGTLLGTIPGGILPTGTTGMKYLGKDGNDEILAVYHYGAPDGYLRVVRIPNGIPANASLIFRTPVLGTANSSGNGDVAFEPNADGMNVDLYVLDTNDGFGGYKSNTLNLVFPDYADAGNPVFAVTPTSRNFGTVLLGATSAVQTFTITNTGAGTITINPADIVLTGADVADFVFTNITEAAVLDLNETATFTVAFAPLTEGAKTATIQINDNLGEKVLHEIALSGTGVDPTLYPPFTQDFNTTPFPPDYWTRFSGVLAETTTMVPTSTGGWAHHIFGNVAGTNNSAYINIYGTKNHWLVTPPIDLGTGDTDYRLTFDIALTLWTGTAQTTLGATDYAAAVISTDNGVTWTNANVLIDWDDSDVISPTGNSVVVSLADYSGIVKIGFYAQRPTGTSPDLRFYVDNVTVEEVPDTPIFTINPTTWDFGDVEVGLASPARVFTISNTGPGTLTVNAPVLDNADDFMLSYVAEDFPAELIGNETVTFSVVFEPEAQGAAVGEIAIGYNDGTANSASVDLTGSGIVRPAGSTCGNPYVIASLPLVDFTGNTDIMGDDYSSTWITPTSSYLNGNDMIFQFTLDEPGYLNASMTSPNTWIGLFILEDCPDADNPAQVIRAATSSGSSVSFANQYMEAGTYFAIVSSYPAPQTIAFTLNLSFDAGYTVTFVVEDEDEVAITDAVITLAGVTNPAGNYVFGAKLPGTFAYTVVKEGFFNATGEVIIVDADVTETVVMIAVPEIPVIVSITPVPDVTVDYGTPEAEALAALAPTTTVTDSNNDTYTVSLTWDIANYDGDVASAYTATGTFTLPEGVEQPDPPLALEVTATVTVLEPPVVIDTFPWHEGFEDEFPPLGWTNAGWTLSTWGTPHTGEEFAYSNLAGSELITPPIILPVDEDLEFSFWYRAESASYPQDMDVLLSIDGTTFDEVIAEIRGLNTATYQQLTYSLADFAGETIQVKFVGLTGTGGFAYGILVDDVMVAGLPELFTVTFVVEDEDAAPITDAVVTLGDVVNAAGNYIFENIMPGTYAYTVVKEGYLDAEGEVVVVDADLTETVTLQMAPLPLARMQIIHNSADAAVEEVDIFVNGDLFLSDFAFRTATPFVDVPAGVNLDIIVAPAGAGIANGVGPVTVNLTEGETYIAIANGIVSTTGYDPATAFSLDVFAAGREAATEATNTDVLVFHGSTDAPTVSVWETGVGAGELFTFSYGEFAGYLELGTADYVLEIRTEDGETTVAAYSAPLSTLGLDGAALTIVASGFLDPSNNSNGDAFGLFVALAAGGDLIALPIYVETFEVTFNVDMTYAEDFDPATDVVYVTGSIFGWAAPGDQPENQTMTRVDDSMIWTKTVDLEAGTYAYKYFLNAGWDGGEWQGGDDRSLVVEADMVVNDWFGSLTDPTTINDPSLAQIRVFPIPARTTLYITSPEVISDLRIIDMLGQVAYSANVAGLSHEVNVGGFKDGIYFIQILTSKGIETRRIQVQK